MKKLVKITGIIFGIVFLILICMVLYVNFTGIPKYEVVLPEYTHVSTPESIERGKKLALTLCAGCHKNHETGKLTGTLMLDAPPEFGKIYSQNITQDSTYGIGNWTDAELLYLLRTGIKKDGQYIPPYMAKLTVTSDQDINAIISFLRSDDPLVAPNPTPDQPSEVSFLTKLLSHLVFKPMPMPTKPIKMPDTTDRVALGKYYIQTLDCFSCHSADFKTNDYLVPENSKGYMAGGNKPLNMEGQIIATSNLTPHKTSGIGNWTEEQFIKAVKFGLVEND